MSGPRTIRKRNGEERSRGVRIGERATVKLTHSATSTPSPSRRIERDTRVEHASTSVSYGIINNSPKQPHRAAHTPFSREIIINIEPSITLAIRKVPPKADNPSRQTVSASFRFTSAPLPLTPSTVLWNVLLPKKVRATKERRRRKGKCIRLHIRNACVSIRNSIDIFPLRRSASRKKFIHKIFRSQKSLARSFYE